jgi:hypothetical protein
MQVGTLHKPARAAGLDLVDLVDLVAQAERDSFARFESWVGYAVGSTDGHPVGIAAGGQDRPVGTLCVTAPGAAIEKAADHGCEPMRALALGVAAATPSGRSSTADTSSCSQPASDLGDRAGVRHDCGPVTDQSTIRSFTHKG